MDLHASPISVGLDDVTIWSEVMRTLVKSCSKSALVIKEYVMILDIRVTVSIFLFYVLKVSLKSTYLWL